MVNVSSRKKILLALSVATLILCFQNCAQDSLPGKASNLSAIQQDVSTSSCEGDYNIAFENSIGDLSLSRVNSNTSQLGGTLTWRKGGSAAGQPIAVSSTMLTGSCTGVPGEISFSSVDGSLRFSGSITSNPNPGVLMSGNVLVNGSTMPWKVVKMCTVVNGVGVQTWTGLEWGLCQIAYCDTNRGYSYDSATQACSCGLSTCN